MDTHNNDIEVEEARDVSLDLTCWDYLLILNANVCENIETWLIFRIMDAF